MTLLDALYPPYTLPLATILIIILGWAFRSHLLLKKVPYPPGPAPQSLLTGNLLDLPTTTPWKTYIEWGKKYGGILHYRIFNKHTVILNTYEDNAELLDKRSAIYSDRPYLPMMDLLGWADFNPGIMHYGPKWKISRRIFQQFFKYDASLNYRPMQSRKVHDFLYSISTTPDEFVHHAQILAAAVIISILYGWDVLPKDDYFVDLSERQIVTINEGFSPRFLFLHVFPILRFLPSWFPGAEFKRVALKNKKVVSEMRDVPINVVQEHMREGKSPDCVVAEFLGTHTSHEEFVAISGVGAAAYGAGAETTVSSIKTLFLAMTLHPDVLSRAQKDIDAVIGSERLITYDDRASLPYIEALYRETLRWRPVAPLSVAHATTSDDIYKGYYIPKGTTVFSNLWAVSHDPSRYIDPDSFNPERFFDRDGKLNDDDVGYVFGFGRRICPGRHVASATIWLAIANVLQNFDIQKKKDLNGADIPVTGEYTDGFTIHPLSFECAITPRSLDFRQLILETVDKA